MSVEPISSSTFSFAYTNFKKCIRTSEDFNISSEIETSMCFTANIIEQGNKFAFNLFLKPHEQYKCRNTLEDCNLSSNRECRCALQ